MKKEDFDQIATLRDLEILRQNLVNDFRGMIAAKINPLKEFYTPKEFAHLTGIKYSTIIYKATTGAIKARQDGAGCSWLIHATELDRFKKESEENV